MSVGHSYMFFVQSLPLLSTIIPPTSAHFQSVPCFHTSGSILLISYSKSHLHPFLPLPFKNHPYVSRVAWKVGGATWSPNAYVWILAVCPWTNNFSVLSPHGDMHCCTIQWAKTEVVLFIASHQYFWFPSASKYLGGLHFSTPVKLNALTWFTQNNAMVLMFSLPLPRPQQCGTRSQDRQDSCPALLCEQEIEVQCAKLLRCQRLFPQHDVAQPNRHDFQALGEGLAVSNCSMAASEEKFGNMAHWKSHFPSLT